MRFKIGDRVGLRKDIAPSLGPRGQYHGINARIFPLLKEGFISRATDGNPDVIFDHGNLCYVIPIDWLYFIPPQTQTQTQGENL
jgi:hypothetical protein